MLKMETRYMNRSNRHHIDVVVSSARQVSPPLNKLFRVGMRFDIRGIASVFYHDGSFLVIELILRPETVTLVERPSLHLEHSWRVSLSRDIVTRWKGVSSNVQLLRLVHFDLYDKFMRSPLQQ